MAGHTRFWALQRWKVCLRASMVLNAWGAGQLGPIEALRVLLRGLFGREIVGQETLPLSIQWGSPCF